MITKGINMVNTGRGGKLKFLKKPPIARSPSNSTQIIITVSADEKTDCCFSLVIAVRLNAFRNPIRIIVIQPKTSANINTAGIIVCPILKQFTLCKGENCLA